MANNRMFMMHIPSRVAIYLGKRLSTGWYDAPEKEKLEAFYEYLEVNYPETQHLLTLAFEDHPFEVNDYTNSNDIILDIQDSSSISSRG